MHELYPIPDCHIEEVGHAGPTGLRIAVQGAHPAASCPACHTTSLSVHSRYRRHPTDLPSFGKEVRLDLLVRRFYCRNPACPRRTFAEPLPNLLAPRARRTRRLATAPGRVGVPRGGHATALGRVGVPCGGESGARLLHRLGMPASADTVLRLVRAIPLPERATPRVLGVDDWGLKKGQTYGTILVDLEVRRVVDLLPDRTAQTLANWLEIRGPIEVIARDRSTEYA